MRDEMRSCLTCRRLFDGDEEKRDVVDLQPATMMGGSERWSSGWTEKSTNEGHPASNDQSLH